ncbi:uncharacterized protein LOC132707430 [Cylas formicarius]|uniref:uncharacterized protein LOC132707430 n=1 Tax=Cylas formicarius TaxID=197179 RepID=UPI002958AEF1|nr:uncharacterized protein LOC132707430 [Cylas formicarius]
MSVDKDDSATEMDEPVENVDPMLDMCRLCDQSGEKMFGIFEDNEDGYEIIRLIKENLPIVIYKSDPLSKQVCETCVETLQTLSVFKKTCRKTQEKYVDELKSNGDVTNKDIQLYLGCTGNKIGDGDDDEEEDDELKDKGTSTDDISILCVNCKQSILDASTVNGEVELCTDLHKIIADSLRKNRVITADSESEKVLRKRKIQPIYQELEDSLCSSLTEFTRNTEDDNTSQYGFDMNSDIETDESGEERHAKRRKIDSDGVLGEQKTHTEGSSPIGDIPGVKETAGNGESVENEEENAKGAPEVKVPEVNFEELFKDEPDVIYEPLSLLQIALNCINVQNVPDYVPEHYTERSSATKCNVCGRTFQNVKLLSLHEPCHIDVEIEEKIDNPTPWPDTHPDAPIRNKWLTYFDENGYEEDDMVVEETEEAPIVEDANLLAPKSNPTWDGTKPDQIVLVDMKPMVNGVYLGDYTKEERKAFYQCMRVGGQTKRFCTLCRYCFKDNWAIESHYFSLACHYTCRHCGMRFNKQRHRFEEHVKEHADKRDPISEKIYTASKVNNIVPKVIHPEKVKVQRIVPGMPETPREIRLEDYETASPTSQSSNPMLTRRLERRSLPPNPAYPQQGFVTIKEEPKDFVASQSKTGNQAFFCRKCYKVFFKLDEFNIHNKNCDYNQQPQTFRTIQFNSNPPGSVAKSPNLAKTTVPSQNSERRNGDLSNAGRPVRNCVKEIGTYKDEVYIPKEILNERTTSNQPQSFVCHICGTPFPTIYSRNSHMRIHKGDMGGLPGMLMPSPHLQMRPHPQQQQHHRIPMQHQQMNYPRFEDVKIKQEPMDSFEPMVEIHEGEQPSSNHSVSLQPRELSGGAVSITPIAKNPNQKPTISPNVMKLVQNNPNITIHKKAPERHASPAQNNNYGGPAPNYINSSPNYGAGLINYPGNSANYGPNFGNYPGSYGAGPQMMQGDADKSYKCSSCWEAFSNKSHLYFHKKNQCEGSRFPCPFCKKRFGTEAAYSSHIFYSHPE